MFLCNLNTQYYILTTAHSSPFTNNSPLQCHDSVRQPNYHETTRGDNWEWAISRGPTKAPSGRFLDAVSRGTKSDFFGLSLLFYFCLSPAHPCQEDIWKIRTCREQEGDSSENRSKRFLQSLQSMYFVHKLPMSPMKSMTQPPPSVRGRKWK